MPNRDFSPLHDHFERLRHLRREYKQSSLDEANVASDPIDQFQRWFADAVTAKLLEPNTMLLATSSLDGKPSVRAVLMKEFGPAGFVFYSNYRSRKGREMASNPQVALLFLWEALERQVRIEGIVSQLPRESSLKYFQSRPREAQIAALSSPQSERLASRAALEEKVQSNRARFGDGAIPLPDAWGGYLVHPERFEFWQGREHRLHDRIEYCAVQNGQWQRSRLAP